MCIHGFTCWWMTSVLWCKTCNVVDAAAAVLFKPAHFPWSVGRHRICCWCTHVRNLRGAVNTYKYTHTHAVGELRYKKSAKRSGKQTVELRACRHVCYLFKQVCTFDVCMCVSAFARMQSGGRVKHDVAVSSGRTVTEKISEQPPR